MLVRLHCSCCLSERVLLFSFCTLIPFLYISWACTDRETGTDSEKEKEREREREREREEREREREREKEGRCITGSV